PRNAQDIAALVYAAVIPPSASDVVRFKIPAGAIPPDVRELNVSARLLWRKFNRPFSEFVRAADPQGFARSGPALPVTELSAAQAGLLIDRRGDEIAYTLKAEPKVPVKEQYFLTHDYGIGLLLQGDTVLARKVLEDLVARILDIDPEDATAYYYTALARRALGDTAGAELAQTAYRYYQRDESAQQMTNEFRRRNPDVNFAAQPIRVYALRSAQQE
ncbi:MAG: hypothetical protein ACK5S1_00645, partial [bacterium]